MATHATGRTGNPHGVRLNNRQADSVRSQIKTTHILKRVQDHVDGKIELSATQVRCAEILLNKTLANLSSIELQAEVTTHELTTEERIARAKAMGLPPGVTFGKTPRK